jgi:hypothetical protein
MCVSRFAKHKKVSSANKLLLWPVVQYEMIVSRLPGRIFADSTSSHVVDRGNGIIAWDPAFFSDGG